MLQGDLNPDPTNKNYRRLHLSIHFFLNLGLYDQNHGKEAESVKNHQPARFVQADVPLQSLQMVVSDGQKVKRDPTAVLEIFPQNISMETL